MLLSVVMLLSPSTEASLPLSTGEAVHGAFIGLIAECVGKALADELDAPGRDKPFTVSPVLGPLVKRGSRVLIHPRRTYWIRFTSVENTLSEVLMEACRKLPALQILDATFRVAGICTDAANHEWAGMATYEQLNQQVAARAERLGLLFNTPTTFRRGKDNLPVPLPELVFGTSLLRKWNKYAPEEHHLRFPPRFSFRTVLRIARYSLDTKIVQFRSGGSSPSHGSPPRGFSQIGFVGSCEFEIKDALEADEQAVRDIKTLADFAVYAGVGYKTAMGMGQARRQF